MAKHGENIHKRKDGRWEGRYIKARTDGRKAVWGYIYGATYAEVRQRLIQKKAEYGFYQLSGNEMTFEELAGQWLASASLRLKESTLVHYHYTLQRYLFPVFGGWQVKNFSEQLLEQGMLQVIAPADHRHRPLGASSARECLTMLRRICKYAAHLRLIRPMEICVSLPQTKSAKIQPSSKEEQARMELFICKAPTARKVGLMLQMQLGLRIGEVCGLQWGDFDLKAGTLTVQRTVSRISTRDGHTKVVIQSPKTRSSRREVPIPRNLIKMLQGLRGDAEPKVWFLSGNAEKPVEPRCYRKSIQIYLRQAAVRKVRPHTLRHTFATTCLQAGCDIKTLSEFLGHANPNVTLQRYVHSNLRQMRLEIDRIFRRFSEGIRCQRGVARHGKTQAESADSAAGSSIFRMEDTPLVRKGVRWMVLHLFEHNARAYQAAAAMLEQYGKAAVVHPTGTGKSYIAFKLIEDHPDAAFLWLSPSEYIFRTQIENLQKQAPDFPLGNVHFVTYARLLFCTEEQLAEIAALHPSYIIMDEFHRAGAERWGERVRELLELCPDAKLLGLTATSVRYLDNNRDMAEELFDGHIASEMTLGEAIVRGILPAPKYVTTVFRYQNELAKYQARVDSLRSPGVQDANQKYLEALRRALEQADGLDRVFAKHITETCGKYIVFCSGKEHMDEMASHVPEWFADVNKNIKVYKTYASDPEASKEFTAFKADNGDHLKLLFCIDMLNEGVHVEGILGVILFRPTVSPIVYKQQIGRALTAGTTAAPLILDVVNNFEGLSSISGLQKEMTDAVQRLYANGEGEKIVTERFEVIEQVQDCRVLFERLENSLSSTWDHYFAAASLYYAEHGDLKVPLRYKTPGGLSLGDWVQTQRQIRKGKRTFGTLTQQQIERLDGIGMVWETRSRNGLGKGLEAARRYRQQYGDLQVPSAYKDADGFALGNWIRNTRSRFGSGGLKRKPDSGIGRAGHGMEQYRRQWERCYAEAAAYYERYGNLEFPKHYVTESGLRLGAWLENQRIAYLKGELSADKAARLEAIGMLWEGRNDRQWLRAYEAATRYFRQHGDLNIPYQYVSPEGIRLGYWVVRQRAAYKGRFSIEKKTNRKPLSYERKRLLDAIGMNWHEVERGEQLHAG